MSAIAPPPFDPRELVLPSVLAMLADVATQLEHPTAQTVHLLAQIAQALDSVHLLAPAKLVRSLEQACQLPGPGPAPERHASSTTLPTTDTAQHLPALRQLAHRDLLRHLEAIAHQQPADTAQLFDSYRALVRLSGKDSAHPADLWEQRPDHAALAELPAEITNRYPTLVPCDAVQLPDDFAQRLLDAAHDRQASSAADPIHWHPTLLALHRDCASSLDAYLARGGRSIRGWLAGLDHQPVHFDQPFANANTLDELARLAAP